MGKTKTQSDVRGVKYKCVNFVGCPLCYGCRNYNNSDPECEKCKQNAKLNVCNTELHKTSLIAKMITKNTVKLSEDTVFKSYEPR